MHMHVIPPKLQSSGLMPSASIQPRRQSTPPEMLNPEPSTLN